MDNTKKNVKNRLEGEHTIPKHKVQEKKDHLGLRKRRESPVTKERALEKEQEEQKENEKENKPDEIYLFEHNYFSRYINLEKTHPLKYVVGLIEENKRTEKCINANKTKCIDICLCNGNMHKLHSNCLMCGKVYCVQMKFSNCIYCNKTLFEFSIFDKIFIENNTVDKNIKKIIEEIKESNLDTYKMYFDSENENMKKAMHIRQRMIENATDDNQTRIIDDSTDWFETNTIDTLAEKTSNFRYYDLEVKEEIIDKFYEVFDKKYSDINVNIDLENAKFEENEDYFKIKELKEYILKIEDKYNSEVKKKRQRGLLQNVKQFLSQKEENNSIYLEDLKNVLFNTESGQVLLSSKKDLKEKTGKEQTEQKENEKENGKKIVKKKKYTVINAIDEEGEVIEESDEETDEESDEETDE